MLYDPTFSEKGVLQAAGRKPRVQDPLDFQVWLSAQEICLLPYNLPA